MKADTNRTHYSAPFGIVLGPAEPKSKRFYVSAGGKRLLARISGGIQNGFPKVKIIAHEGALR